MVKLFWVSIVLGIVFTNLIDIDAYHINETELSLLEAHEASFSLVATNPHMVGITIIHSAAAKGAGTNSNPFLIFIFHLISSFHLGKFN